MKNLFISILLFFITTMSATNPIEIKIWGQDSSEPQPTLTVYPATNGNGMAIIACPGGGYTHLAIDHEGKSMSAWFNSLGITYAVLVYRMPGGNHEIPLSDAQQAMRIMRQHAKEWNIQKLGIMGASAGGHLASTVATHYTDAETKPDFQILFYPVITMDASYTHAGSRKNLLGQSPSEELVKQFSNELQVNAQTPPAFIMHSSNDKTVPVANSVNYYMALIKNHVENCCLHTYPTGGHGWGYRDSFEYKRQWTGELEKWLREINK